MTNEYSKNISVLKHVPITFSCIDLIFNYLKRRYIIVLSKCNFFCTIRKKC